ncbi:MAG TPA: HEAT repeat domain-containing protein [Polyangiaceae bacterium LLY-WYZ-15_(1-7)]|nr:HEAT repeat domain-containing protein [Polyangiaceae bacterium LLY-WYZ-15_(1-7)]HJL11765.1 HEAT repeat domain-containing protein [Polyangiaceae bacterium LLY-WYZ-15_(1-7)]HJL28412.1 HEAT repeat domain-containing protein [Polyangiaceae bacterium LLY-WYZ-15_(1-7)]
MALVMGFVLLGSSTALARMSDEEFQQAMQQLQADSPDERLEAVELLGRRGWRRRREISPRLRRLLRTDPDWRVRASSGRAIGRLSVRDAVPDLVAALRDPQVEVRVVAAAALWRLPDAAAVPGLIALLDDRDAAARQWGALALGVVRDRRATEPLIRMLGDTESAVRMDAIRSLGRIADPAALDALRGFVSNGDNAIEERLEAINSIAALESPDKVNVLGRLLGDDEERIRLRAVRALGQVGDMLAVPPLRRLKGNERSGEIREAIDEAIAAIRQRAREARENRGN